MWAGDVSMLKSVRQHVTEQQSPRTEELDGEMKKKVMVKADEGTLARSVFHYCSSAKARPAGHLQEVTSSSTVTSGL